MASKEMKAVGKVATSRGRGKGSKEMSAYNRLLSLHALGSGRSGMPGRDHPLPAVPAPPPVFKRRKLGRLKLRSGHKTRT
jgi:hypothetical protein